MKLLLMFAASVALGCGIIFTFVHGLAPYLVRPTLFPAAQAREPAEPPVTQAIADAGAAVAAGTVTTGGDFVAAR